MFVISILYLTVLPVFGHLTSASTEMLKFLLQQPRSIGPNLHPAVELGPGGLLCVELGLAIEEPVAELAAIVLELVRAGEAACCLLRRCDTSSTASGRAKTVMRQEAAAQQAIRKVFIVGSGIGVRETQKISELR